MRPNILNAMVCSSAQQQPQLPQHQQPQLPQPHQPQFPQSQQPQLSQPQLSHQHPLQPPLSQPLVQHQNFRHDPTLEILQQTVQGTIHECEISLLHLGVTFQCDT